MMTQKVFPVFFGICFAFYLIYHIIQGDRGVISWIRLHHKMKEAEIQLKHVQEERMDFEKQVRLLQPQSLDLDLLEERAMDTLSLAPEDSIIFYHQPGRDMDKANQKK
jgi:cell division protein FtsB